jgi:hypothetical protein
VDVAGCQGAVPDPDFTIRILRPSGWYTDKANVEIRLADENKTGWAKVEVKIEKNGSWIDLTDDFLDTDRTTLEISENCTIYVTVTDKDGKAHTKNAYIECFDREVPPCAPVLTGRCCVWKPAMSFRAWSTSISTAIASPASPMGPGCAAERLRRRI